MKRTATLALAVLSCLATSRDVAWNRASGVVEIEALPTAEHSVRIATTLGAFPRVPFTTTVELSGYLDAPFTATLSGVHFEASAQSESSGKQEWVSIVVPGLLDHCTADAPCDAWVDVTVEAADLEAVGQLQVNLAIIADDLDGAGDPPGSQAYRIRVED